MDEIKNLLITGLAIGLALSLGFMGYVYTTKDITSKNAPLQKQLDIQDITFDNLPPSIQNQYISKKTYFEEISKIEKEKAQVTQELDDVIQDTKNNLLLKKTALIQKDQDEITIKGNVQQAKQQKLTNRSKYKTYTCKDFQKGSIVVPKSCKQELYRFLDKYQSTTKEFEVIGMVDHTEFKLIRNLEDVYGTSEVKEVKKYVQIGLSRQRVIETTWLIKEYLETANKIGAVNYTVYSNNKRGFVVRAYY